MISPLAELPTKYGRKLFTSRRGRNAPLYGVMLHTTGSGLSAYGAGALKKGVEIYTRSGGPHYVIGWDGTIVATADERIQGAHAGVTDADAQYKYKYGGWENRVSAAGTALWKERWPGKSSPIDLIPNRNMGSINDLWIGIEMIPITGGGSKYWADPAYPGSRFTSAQHDAAKALSHDIATRWGFPVGWTSKSSSRLIGHSDINPIQRDSPNLPLWDPGYHTDLFDINWVRGGGWSWVIWAGAAVGAGLLVAPYLRRRLRT